jgi:hypothetical protein
LIASHIDTPREKGGDIPVPPDQPDQDPHAPVKEPDGRPESEPSAPVREPGPTPPRRLLQNGPVEPGPFLLLFPLNPASNLGIHIASSV